MVSVLLLVHIQILILDCLVPVFRNWRPCVIALSTRYPWTFFCGLRQRLTLVCWLLKPLASGFSHSLCNHSSRANVCLVSVQTVPRRFGATTDSLLNACCATHNWPGRRA